MAIISFLPGWTRRDVEHGQNAFQRDRVKDHRDTNHMPARMNDLDRDSEGKRKAYWQERRVVLLAAARAGTVTGAVDRKEAAFPDTAATNRAHLPGGFRTSSPRTPQVLEALLAASRDFAIFAPRVVSVNS
jgi:hypothetical protein